MTNLKPQDQCVSVVKRGEKFRAASFMAWPVPGFKALYWIRDDFLSKEVDFETAKNVAQDFATKTNIPFLWKVSHLTLAAVSWSRSSEWAGVPKKIEEDPYTIKPVDPETQTPPDYLKKSDLEHHGLTKSQIEQLGDPDRLLLNPHYKSAAPMQLWLASRFPELNTPESAPPTQQQQQQDKVWSQWLAEAEAESKTNANPVEARWLAEENVDALGRKES
jgi:hypothetical protein